MAGLKKNNSVEKTLDKFIAGDVDSPVETSGANGKLLKKLEDLRQTLLAGRERAVRANVENRESIANVAHDLKTPLALISGFAECIVDGMDDKDYPALISEKAGLMNDLIMSLIETAKHESGETAELKERTDAPEFFKAEIEKHRLLVKKHGLKMKIGHIPVVSLYIDRLQMGNVIQNLVSNAVKYSKSGGKVKITFKVRAGMLRVKVSDDGIGIASEDLPRIFDKFFMEDKARKPGSSGLGLYIAKKQIENHGGDINVKSRRGNGSTFTFKLPVVPALKEEKDSLDKFESKPLRFKLPLIVAFGWILPWLFRLMKFAHSRRGSTFAGVFLAFVFFPIAWAMDIISEITYGRMYFLMD